MSALTHVAVAPMPLDRFKGVLSPEAWEEIEETVRTGRIALEGRVVWNVNSTARGGGVAEMLRSMLSYSRSVGVDARWVVIGGNPEFFTLTKRLHNKLHGHPGDGGPLGEAEHRVYEEALEEPAAELKELMRPGDILLLHDPQTAGLVPAIDNGTHVVWRSHIGRDQPNEHVDEAWNFLIDYVRPAERWVFSREKYVPPGLDHDRVTIVPPSIDAFSPKNQFLDDDTVAAIVTTAGLVEGDPTVGTPTFTREDGTPGRVDRKADLGDAGPAPADAPLVTQVSRWDRLKDPVGVLQGFVDHIAPHVPDAHLILAGPAVAAVSDDPEGADVLAEVQAAAGKLSPELRSRVHLAALPMDDAEENAATVNALQRASTVVVQKSIAEGFGLTVAEAMWKGRAVVASAVGGIQDQIEDGTSGILLQDPSDLEEYGNAVRRLLENPEQVEVLGAAALTRVREHFLNARHLVQYGRLFEALVENE